MLYIPFIQRMAMAGALLLLGTGIATCQSAAQSNGDSGSSSNLNQNSTDTATLPLGFYVATDGNDDNPGTLSEPFKTLARAQKAMKDSSSIKTTYIRAGHYKPATVKGSCLDGKGSGTSINLGRSDKGETWSYYPPDGYNSAVIDGQSTEGNSGGSGGNGTGCAFSGNTLTDITIVGLQIENYRYSAFWVDNGNNLTFKDNVVHNIRAAVWGTGAVATMCAPNLQVKNNYMYDLAYTGMELETGSRCPNGIANDVLSGNVIINSCTWPAVHGFGNDQNGGDCSAIYLHDGTSSSSNIQVVNNYIRDINAASKGAGDYGHDGKFGCCATAVYLDTGTHNVDIKGNIIAGMMSACAQFNYPENVSMTGNICDLASDSDYQSIVIYGRGKVDLVPMPNNKFEHNIVISAGNGTGFGFYGATKTLTPLYISDNDYHNYVGSSIKSTGNQYVGSDSDPVKENPQLSGWTYTMAKSTQVSNSPVSFARITGGWGPPGFTIPHNGTAPSCPH